MKKKLLIIIFSILLVMGCTKTPQIISYDINEEKQVLKFKWTTCKDKGFYLYNVYSSIHESMENKESIFESNNRRDTTLTISYVGPPTYYQVQTTYLNEKKTLSNKTFKPFLVQEFGIRSNLEGNSVQQTTDGGYIIVGTYKKGIFDEIWLMKTDSNGNEVWNKTFGEEKHNHEGISVHQTTDGGYIFLKQDINYGKGWLIKTDSNGNEEWNKTLSGVARLLQLTTDGGYIIVGDEYYSNYVWLIKTDSNGNEEWNKTFGEEEGNYEGISVQQTTDDGYIILGEERKTIDGGVSRVWLIKTDSNGNEEWNKSFVKKYYVFEFSYSVQQTTDNGYIFTGFSSSSDDSDVWLVKTDSNGNELWNKTVGNKYFQERGYSIQKTTDGGYIVVGKGLIKFDSYGNVQWSKKIDGIWIQQTTDGGYIILNQQRNGIWLIKTDENGSFQVKNKPYL